MQTLINLPYAGKVSLPGILPGALPGILPAGR